MALTAWISLAGITLTVATLSLNYPELNARSRTAKQVQRLQSISEKTTPVLRGGLEQDIREKTAKLVSLSSSAYKRRPRTTAYVLAVVGLAIFTLTMLDAGPRRMSTPVDITLILTGITLLVVNVTIVRSAFLQDQKNLKLVQDGWIARDLAPKRTFKSKGQT